MPRAPHRARAGPRPDVRSDAEAHGTGGARAPGRGRTAADEARAVRASPGDRAPVRPDRGPRTRPGEPEAGPGPEAGRARGCRAGAGRTVLPGARAVDGPGRGRPRSWARPWLDGRCGTGCCPPAGRPVLGGPRPSPGRLPAVGREPSVRSPWLVPAVPGRGVPATRADSPYGTGTARAHGDGDGRLRARTDTGPGRCAHGPGGPTAVRTPGPARTACRPPSGGLRPLGLCVHRSFIAIRHDSAHDDPPRRGADGSPMRAWTPAY